MLTKSFFVTVSQICPAPLQVRTDRNSTSSDLRSILKPRLSSPLTSFKSYSTRTPTYLWDFLSFPFCAVKTHSFEVILCYMFLRPWFVIVVVAFLSLLAVWPCPAAWTQPRHAKSPVRPLNKGKLTGNTSFPFSVLRMSCRCWSSVECKSLSSSVWWRGYKSLSPLSLKHYTSRSHGVAIATFLTYWPITSKLYCIKSFSQIHFLNMIQLLTLHNFPLFKLFSYCLFIQQTWTSVLENVYTVNSD